MSYTSQSGCVLRLFARKVFIYIIYMIFKHDDRIIFLPYFNYIAVATSPIFFFRLQIYFILLLRVCRCLHLVVCFSTGLLSARTEVWTIGGSCEAHHPPSPTTCERESSAPRKGKHIHVA